MSRRTTRLGARVGATIALLGALGLTAPAFAGGTVDPSLMPGPLGDVRFDQNLGASLPLDLAFVDESGRAVTLGDYFDGERPVVLVFVYYHCPMLCPLTLNGVAKSLSVLKLDVGREFDVVAVSIDPKETTEQAAAALASTVERYGRPRTEGWHFLTGSNEAIRRAADVAGFRYAYVPESDEYAHASGLLVVTPEGRIAQYFYGFEFSPKDLRLALVEASSNRIGNVIDQVLLYCYRYDPKLGKYTAVTMRILRLSGALFALGLAVFVWIMWRRERALETLTTSPSGVA